ncbi:hypothetical protein M9H77_11398 [Catharanthus roseus]|uniref:Uncharacterized protein n=1 Tax=Catharanthus roseus TaxID=4058 RepID=A0ACC0BEI4_CATRO|nr:hypothetical protein M9H77_11398 [Catharanthus roseus]
MNNPSKKISVLVVDDDPMVRRINNAFLNKYKLETQVAKNGKEAVEFCISGNCFDLILMDMEMPIMDGPQATKELRAMGVNSRIVGLTSRNLESEKKAFIEAGLDDCLEKPLNNRIIEYLLQSLQMAEKP